MRRFSTWDDVKTNGLQTFGMVVNSGSSRSLAAKPSARMRPQSMESNVVIWDVSLFTSIEIITGIPFALFFLLSPHLSEQFRLNSCIRQYIISRFRRLIIIVSLNFYIHKVCL